MSSSEYEDFSLYMSNVEIIEKEHVEIELTYEGETENIDRLLLIGEKNGLSANVHEALEFKKEIRNGRTVFVISFPVWEDGNFKAIIEKNGEYFYEPGEAHNLVFRGKGVFLNLRKIYHLSKEPTKPKKLKKAKEPKVPEEAKKTEKISKREVKKPKEPSIPKAYDENNKLTIQPKDFRQFGPQLKEKLLQLLDYLTNDQSKKLNIDTVILPEIARSLKRCINDEIRASVFDLCFPVIILIQKALVLTNLVYEQKHDEDLIDEYNKTIVPKAKELKETIRNAEFKETSELMKKEYDDDIHALKLRFLELV